MQTNRTYGFGELPHSTGNAALAFSLYIAGIPFADDKSPLTNTYDADILRGLGFGGPIEQAAKEAFAKGLSGRVEYGFKRVPELSEAVAAFDDAQKAARIVGVSARLLCLGITEKHAGGQISLTEGLSSATCIIVKRWRAEQHEWVMTPSYALRRNKNKAADYDSATLAKETFLTGDFHSFAAAIMDARECFLNLFKRYEPIIRLRHGNKASKDGQRARFPGFVLYSTNADRETRRTLGVPTL